MPEAEPGEIEIDTESPLVAEKIQERKQKD